MAKGKRESGREEVLERVYREGYRGEEWGCVRMKNVGLCSTDHNNDANNSIGLV